MGHATTDAVTDTGASGDILTFANEVYDADDKNKIGTDQGICFSTVPGKAWECVWTLSLDKGQGEFAGALGEMALSARGTKGDAYNFVYRIK